MILYFSATGNCKFIAEKIAKNFDDKAYSIVDCMKESTAEYVLEDGEMFGIVTPTYFWELPIIVKEFLEEITIKRANDNYMFSVSAYGTTPGASGACIEHIMKKKEVSLDASFSVITPDTWTVIYDLSNQNHVSDILQKTDDQIRKVITKIKEEVHGNHMNRCVPYAASFICDKFAKASCKTAHLYVEDSCIGCGLCEVKCPANAIKMKEGKPEWVKDQCVMCLGCLHRCPKFAIQYGNRTKKHGQYKNPNVTI